MPPLACRRCLGFGFSATIMAGLFLVAVSVADTPNPNASAIAAAFEQASAGVLDGRTFRVRIVGDSENRTAADRITFRSGHFSSELCRKYNFADALYWIRREGDKVLFKAETTSPTDGRMIWTGTIEGGELRGEMLWTKPRWYRTVRSQHRFAGTSEQ